MRNDESVMVSDDKIHWYLDIYWNAFDSHKYVVAVNDFDFETWDFNPDDNVSEL